MIIIFHILFLVAMTLMRNHFFILIFFSFLSMISFLGQLIMVYLDLPRPSDDIVFKFGVLVNLSCLFAIIFLKGLKYLPHKLKTVPLSSHRKKLIIVSLLSILPSIYMVHKNFTKAQIVHSSGYIEGYSQFSTSGLGGSTLLPIVLLFSFISILGFIKTKRIIYFSFFFIISMSFLLYGARSFFIYSILPIIGYLLSSNKIALYKIVGFTCFLLFILVSIGSIREGNNGINLLYRLTVEFSSIPLILENIEIMHAHPLPISDIVKSIVPNKLLLIMGFDTPDTLATIFVNSFDPGWAKLGGGYGFSLIAEIIVRFGVIFMPIIFTIIFLALDRLEKAIKNRENNLLLQSAALSLFSNLLMLIRGDLIEVSRSIVFFVFLMWFAKYKFRINEKI